MKRLLSLFTILFIAVAVFAYDFKVNGIYYNKLSDSNTCEVTHKYSYNEDGYGWEVLIPSSVTYNGTTYIVTGIGSSAFSSSGSSIRNVIIPSSVTTIGSHAFDGCTYITDINIPSSVTEIGAYAFQGTAWYKNQSDGMIYAGKVAYEYKGLMPENTSIIIKDGTKGIGDQAFYYQSGLTSITIPSSVTSIGNNAFRNCSGLTNITIPESVTNIGSFTFAGTALTDVLLNSNAIASNTYSSSRSLKDIFGKQVKKYTLGNNVTSIGNYAFSDCSGLTSITIPSSVTSIGSNAFLGCSGLTKVIVSDIAKWCSISFDDNPLYYAKHLYSDENTEITELAIPDGVTSIGSAAFNGCSGLTSVTIPESVTSIGSAAFDGCSGLTSITIPSSVTSIGERAFSGCSGLTSITIPEGVTSIGGGAFSGCTGLTSITIPSNVTSIGSSAFSGCSGLTSVTVPSSVTSIGSSAFSGCSELSTVTINSNDIVSKYYTSTSNISTIFGSQVKEYILGNEVTTIGSNAFYKCSNITGITIPSSVTTIGNSAFTGCSGLTNITIPESVTNIGSSAFSGCTGLTSITIPEGVTTICDYAFSGCTGLTSITIPESVTSISSSAFSGCSGLTSITIPEGVATIGSAAFSGCSGLTSITIPKSVTSIGSSAFQGCTELTSIILPDNITSIGSGTYRSFLTSTKLYVNIGSKTLLTLWKNGYSSIYNAETGEIVSQPYLSKENSTQTTLEVKLYNKYKGYIYRCNNQILSSDIISFSELYPNCSKWIDIAISSGDVSYSISRSYSTNDINPIVTGNATNASSLSVNGNYAKGDAKVVKEIIKCNSKEFEGQSVSINGLTPNSSYDVEYVVTVAYGSNNQYKTYSSTKTVKTKELTLTTEQPKVVSSGNVIVSATTNVDEEEKNVGFEWRRTDWTSDFASNSGSAVIFDNTMEGYIRNLNTDKLWTYRAYYLSDAGVYYYGDWVGLDASNTSYFEPTVHTYADISTSGKVALIRGYVLNGSDKITVQGFKYWKTANKSNSLDIAMEGEAQAAAVNVPADAITETVDIVGAGQQLMNATLNNLDYGSTYECVAFATTAGNETFYGEVQSFTTEADPTGIEGVKEDAGSSKAVTVVACYDINGKRLSAPQKGLNIIKMSDGTTRKVVK